MNQLNEYLQKIKPLDQVAMDKAKKRLDNLTKPLGSLGRLEELIIKTAGIKGEVFPDISKKAVVIMCSDNGVVDEGISQSGREITAMVTKNFTRGITGINVFSALSGAELVIVDIGVEEELLCEGILNKKIRNGTSNMAIGPAMSREEALRAVLTGIEIMAELKNRGFGLVATGEMGIGNTTTSSAVACVLTGQPHNIMVGRGAGLSNDGLARKKAVVEKAICVNKPNPEDAIDVLSKVGGFDIAGLAGCFIGGAVYGIPVIIDGFISAVAALAAVRISSAVKDYIFPSHGSAEPGSSFVMKELGFKPYLELSMRLGEGTGAVLAFYLFDAAYKAFTCMGTFADADIEQYKPL